MISRRQRARLTFGRFTYLKRWPGRLNKRPVPNRGTGAPAREFWRDNAGKEFRFKDVAGPWNESPKVPKHPHHLQ